MKNKVLVVLSVTVGLLMASGPMFAHHGGQAYDKGKLKTLKGTVVKFLFINPHPLLLLKVKGDKGNVEEWTMQFHPPARLARGLGWNRNTLKPGDQITVIGHPEKTGHTLIMPQKIVMPDGREVDPDNVP